MAIRITEDGVVNYENSPDINRKLFPNLNTCGKEIDKSVEVSGQTPVIVAEENTRYICGEVTSLDFTPCASGICDIRFTTASISTVLTLPQTVKFPVWFDPTALEVNTTYEINVMDGIYGAVMSWA